MADPRSVMQEFRFLEQKRQAGSLTPAEAARHAELRDLVGFEQPLPARGGFDVAAAAAQLRESLLPAGLRSRPPQAPPLPAAPPAEVAPPAPAPPPQPVAAPEPAAELLFDPASLGQEVRPQAWNPEAPGYDPDAPFDEAAWIAAGYDPTVSYDWSGTGAAEPAAGAAGEAAGPAPLQFGEYDAVEAAIAPGEPAGLAAPALEAAPGGDDGWLDDGGAAAAAPPPPAPAFGEYDGPPLALGQGGDSLELGEPSTGWLSDGTIDGGFELASGGSFGEPVTPARPAPWSAPEPAEPAEHWESAPALDLSTPFEPVPIPAAPRAEPLPQPAAEVLSELEPEETLEPIPEPTDRPGQAPPASPALDPLPAEAAWLPPPLDLAASSLPPSDDAGEPVSLGDLDPSFEIDVPPEISAAYDQPSPPSDRLAFDAPLPAAAPPSPEVSPGDVEPLLEPEAPAPPAAAAPRRPAPVPAPEVEPEIVPVPVPARGSTRVVGEHRVVVHTLDGAVLRGTLTDCDLDAPELALDTGAPGLATQVMSAAVKAIFFMLAPGQAPPEPLGKRVRVAFRDGRQVAGFSPDYQEGGVGFFMIPVDTRTNTGRIWVYQAAVKQVTIN